MLATLERAMGDLMAQVESMRDDTFQAVEQAARTAVAGTLGAAPAAAAGPDFCAIERDLADLKAHHRVSDKRTHDTLEAVHQTLEQVAARLANARTARRAPTQDRVHAEIRCGAGPAASVRGERPD